MSQYLGVLISKPGAGCVVMRLSASHIVLVDLQELVSCLQLNTTIQVWEDDSPTYMQPGVGAWTYKKEKRFLRRY